MMVSSAVQYLDIYDNENLPKRKKGLKFIQMQIITICPNTVKLAKWPNLDTLIKKVNLTAITISNKKITTRLMPRQLAVELIITEFLNRRCLPTYLFSKRQYQNCFIEVSGFCNSRATNLTKSLKCFLPRNT